MFLGKWNSDNSYYLYEQIKTLFYQAMGAAAFIRAEGAPQLGWALLAPCKAPGCVWELEASLGGVLLSCILRASLTHPTHLIKCDLEEEDPSLALSPTARLGCSWWMVAILPCWDAGGWIWSFHAVGGGGPFQHQATFQSFAVTVLMLVQTSGASGCCYSYTLSTLRHKNSLSLSSEESQASAIQSSA